VLQQVEDPLRQQRQHGSGHRTGKHQGRVVHRQPGHDALAQAACADEGRDGGDAHVQHGCRLDAGEDRRRRQRQLDAAQHLAVAHAQRQARVPHAFGQGGQAGMGVAHDGQQRIDRQRQQAPARSRWCPPGR
jgi:hypothetical protein